MVKQYRINIDGKEITALPGQTILEAARENDIYIPSLCYDERMEVYGACGICVVEVEGNPKLLKACATEVAPGMVVHTKTDRVRESRKTNLELLLSNHVGDCRPPCAKECPAQTDCIYLSPFQCVQNYRRLTDGHDVHGNLGIDAKACAQHGDDDIGATRAHHVNLATLDKAEVFEMVLHVLIALYTRHAHGFARFYHRKRHCRHLRSARHEWLLTSVRP